LKLTSNALHNWSRGVACHAKQVLLQSVTQQSSYRWIGSWYITIGCQ